MQHDFTAYAAHLREFIRRHSPETGPCDRLAPDESERQFAGLARELFRLQFAANLPFRALCLARGVTPGTLPDWRAIPAVPTEAFKDTELTCLAPSERDAVFHSSGTTGQRPSRHFHSAESLALYEASLKPWFRRYLLADCEAASDGEELVFLSLTPPPAAAPRSSLVHMIGVVLREFGAEGSLFAGEVGVDGAWAIDFGHLLTAMPQATAAGRPVLLLGTAFNFVHLLDHLAAEGIRLQLAAGSRVMETGGYKGRSRELPKAELHARLAERLGIPRERIITEYGMSELSSQAYEVWSAERGARNFRFPPWARATVVSPETGREVADGEIGLLRILDLANAWSVMAVQTGDLAVRRGAGFELLGRAATVEPRGCSLMAA